MTPPGSILAAGVPPARAPRPGSALATFRLDATRRVAVNMPSAEALIADLDRRLLAGEGFTVATINLDHLVKLGRDAAFREAYLATTHVVADGHPVVWLARLQGRPVGLVPGSELVEPLCALAARRRVPVALFGATDAALEGAARRLAAAHPGLEVVERIAPPFGFDPGGSEADALIRRLGESTARLVFVALGAPKQERFAMRAAAALPGRGFVSVGAGIDFIAGTQVRAPRWVQRLAAEWIWRMLHDPRRLAGRYAACIAALPGLAADSLRQRDEAPRGRP
jgi:exopolysaccharide biosynthesis WecB/TagA/CpsF family protein